jgi:RHS repeat-associated protein
VAAAEGIIAKAVRDLLRVVAKDAEKSASKDALRAAERDAARAAGRDAAKDAGKTLEQDAAKRAEQDAARSLEKKPVRGDPVDVATGAVVQFQVDVELPGLLPLVLSRTHVSSYREGRWFGRSWASTLDQRLEVSAAQVRFLAEDGSSLVYPVTDGVVAGLPRSGRRWRLAAEGDGYAVTDVAAGRSLHFARRWVGQRLEWPLVRISDRGGHAIDVVYDAAGNPNAVRHSGGGRLLVETAGGRVVALQLAAESGGLVPLTRYGYDDAGDLTEVVNSSGVPMRFEYDAEGRMSRWTDRNGDWYRYGYDVSGRCVRGENAGGYLNATFAYDPAAGTTTVTNSLGHATVYELSRAGQLAVETDPLGNTIRYEWDEHDRLLAVTDPLGRTARYGYDAAGNLASVTRPDGPQVTATYDGRGLPVRIVDPDGGAWLRDYDRRGNLLAVTDPAGAVTRYRRGEDGDLVGVEDTAGQSRLVETDAAGLVSAVSDPLGATTRYRRDIFGRVSEVSDPAGATTRYGWTVEGRLAWRQSPGGGVDRFRYDGELNMVEQVDAAGQRTRVEVGHFDAVVAQTGPDGATLRLAYDSELRLTSVTDPRGLVWRYEYDPAGRLVREVDYNGRAVRYRRDAAGQLVERVNGAGQSTSYRYDQLGRLVEQRSPGSVATFGYDQAGRLIRAVNADAEVEFVRDARGRVILERCDGRAVESGYDLLGRRVWRRTPSGHESRWEYRPDGQPLALHGAGHSIRFGYDAAGREVARRIGPDVLLVQAWDADRRLRSQTVTAGGLDSTGQGRPADSARLVHRRTFQYRPDGYLTGIDDPAGPRRFDLDPAGRVTAVHAPQWTESYRYDPAGNCTHAAWPAAAGTPRRADGPRDYAGTLLRQAGDTWYDHDGQGRVVATGQRHAAGAQPSTSRFRWDADDRLVEATTPDGHHWRYRYDALGRRISKQRLLDGHVTHETEFSWDGTVLAEQRSARSAISWDLDPAGFTPLTQVEHHPSAGHPQGGDEHRFYAVLTDLAGTPTDLLATTGAVAWRSAASTWGASPAAVDGPADCPLRFPGQYHDPETGLHYNYQRYYDPEAGRYLTDDPLGLAAGLNPSAYVTNPTRLIDPFGLSPYDPSSVAPDARRTLFHYTTEDGQKGIVSSEELHPSLKSVNPQDARYGDGQYLSDIAPGTRTNAQLSRAFIGQPFQGARFTHYVEIDVTGLNVVEGRPGVFVIPNQHPLDLVGRIVRSGRN